MEVAAILNKVQGEDLRAAAECLEEAVSYVLHGKGVSSAFREFCENINILLAHRKMEIPRSVASLIKELLKRIRGTGEGRNFLHNLIKYLLRGIDSKFRHVRVNSMEVMRGSIESLENVNSRLWERVKRKVGEKMFDREAAVRVIAAGIACRHQEDAVDGELTFKRILKDLLRHDPSAEVRRLVVSKITAERTTLPAILERAVDCNDSVRMALVERVPSLDLSLFEQGERAVLLGRMESERNPEIRKKFLSGMEMLFRDSFMGEYESLVSAFFVEGDNSPLSRVLRELMKSYEYIVEFDEHFISRAVPSLVFLMNVSLEHTEEEKGRDALVLPDLEVGLKWIVDCVGEEYVSELFKTIGFYDLFGSCEKALVGKFSVYLLGKTNSERVIKETVVLVRKAFGTETKILRKILSSNSSMETVSEIARVYPELPQTNEALFSEICVVVQSALCKEGDKSAALRAHFFLALASNSVSTQTYIERFGSLSIALEILVDLVLILDSQEAADFLRDRIRAGAVSCKYIAKLIAAERFSENERMDFLCGILCKFYSGGMDADETQFIHVFLHEHFGRRPADFLSLYQRVVNEIHHWKVFNDQGVLWCAQTGSLFSTALEMVLESVGSKSSLHRHLDFLDKAFPKRGVLSDQAKKRAVEIASLLSKHVSGQDSEIVKEILFELISSS
jgi:hypothetical protein